MREIEIKLRAPDLSAVTKKLEQLGCVISQPKKQEDRNFVHKDDVRWYESSNAWAYPRLRIEDGKPMPLTVKKPVENEMDCIEANLHVDDAETLAEVMKVLNYIPNVVVKKTRRTTHYANGEKKFEITMDEVEGLSSFVEIEQLVEEGDAEKMQKEMFQWAKENLGLEKDEAVMTGYDILLHRKETAMSETRPRTQ